MRRLARVLIVLPVHNAQDRLERQLDSLLGQLDVDVSLLVSDNASTDATFRMLESRAEEDSRVRIIYKPANEGLSRNLMELLHSVPVDDYDYFAIAHQGDVWEQDRLQLAIAHITGDTSRPELYYSDVNIIDSPGVLTRCALQGFAPCASHPSSLLLVPNWAWSCSMVMNGALIKLLRKYRAFEFGRSCDAWIHAVALYCGGYVFSDLSVARVNHCPSADELSMLADIDDWPLEDARMSAAFTEMACKLLEAYADEMNQSIASTVEAVAMRGNSSKARRYLFKCADIAMPSNTATSRLRWHLMMGKF